MSLPGESLVDAYRSMRSGVLYLFVSWIIIAIAFVFVIMSVFAMVSLTTPIYIGRAPRGVGEVFPVLDGRIIYLAIMFIVIIIIGVVIALIGLWGKFIPGVSKLAVINPEFSTSATLIKIGMLWGLILLVIGVVSLVVLIGIVILIVAAILILLGSIGLIILNFKLNDVEKNSLYLVAGILFIVGIFLPIADIIGWILMYIALGESIRKRSAIVPAPQSLV